MFVLNTEGNWVCGCCTVRAVRLEYDAFFSPRTSCLLVDIHACSHIAHKPRTYVKKELKLKDFMRIVI